MFTKFNVKSISKGYKKSFQNAKGNITCLDKLKYFYSPYIISFILCCVKLPDSALIDLLGISLSIFIGFFLSVIAILLSVIGNKKVELNYSDQKLRLNILEESLYSILYAILQSIKALITLYLLNIISLNNTEIGDLYYIIIEHKIDSFIQFILSIFLYKYNVSLIFSFFIILKNIISLFRKDIEIELFNIRQEENKKEK